MKKPIAILFLLVYLFSTTDAYQLVKLPVVYQHYAEHKLADSNLSFLAFLDMHYLHGTPHDNDYKRDMQLPFKTSGDCVSAVANEFVPLNEQFCITTPVLIVPMKKVVIQHNDILSSFLSNIWQPPKSC